MLKRLTRRLGRRSQFEFGHDPLSTFMINRQVDGNSAMTIGWMLTMNHFDLLFESQVFCGLFELSIDVLATDAQCVGTDRLQLASADYLDFFC